VSLNPRIETWRGRTVWLVGASSGIGRATAHELHERGARVLVSARNEEALATFVQTHERSVAIPFDVTRHEDTLRAAQRVREFCGCPDLVFVCSGHYKAQRATAFDRAEMIRHQDVNYVGTVNVLDATLPLMLGVGRGHLSLMGSVAGYRGLPHALAYGPTKAALNNLAEILYLDLHDRGIGVSIVNPGFVETPLTAGNHFHMPALLKPEEAAHEIIRGWERGQFEMHFPRRFTMGLKTMRAMWHGLYFATVRRATGL
jgi:NAD(P)-dependent dehydrogenase (short-subunit alcohol dehydrogenase family)